MGLRIHFGASTDDSLIFTRRTDPRDLQCLYLITKLLFPLICIWIIQLSLQYYSMCSRKCQPQHILFLGTLAGKQSWSIIQEHLGQCTQFGWFVFRAYAVVFITSQYSSNFWIDVFPLLSCISSFICNNNILMR